VNPPGKEGAVKLLKMLGLAVFAATVVMAFGASAASAAAGDIDACLYTTGNPALTEAGCKSVSGTIDTKSIKSKYVAKAAGPILKGTLEEKCNESNTTTETKGDGTNGFLVTALSFTGSCGPCTEVETFAPYSGEIIMEGENYFLKSNGGAKLKGCPFGVNCKFGSKNITLKLVYGAEMASNEFRAEAESLTLEEGSKLLCGSTGTWTANYVVSSPSRFFFFLL
jgi:hypothetical protein